MISETRLYEIVRTYGSEPPRRFTLRARSSLAVLEALGAVVKSAARETDTASGVGFGGTSYEVMPISTKSQEASA